MKQIKKQYKAWRTKWFGRKKIIQSTTHSPGEFVKFVKGQDGNKYVRIALTNRQQIKGYNPVTDVLYNNVVGVHLLPSLLQVKLAKLIGYKLKYKNLKIVN